MTASHRIDMNRIVGSHDLLFATLDTLRYDVACAALEEGLTPNLAARLPDRRWEERHSPGSFTYSAHAAFFAGFLPTPATPGRHPRPFALRFAGSETTVAETCVLDGRDIVSGLAARGYRTACVGGVGFFNKRSELGCVFPELFQESHWSPELGVTEKRSAENQVRLAVSILEQAPRDQRLFLFVNFSAIHQPNRHYVDGATEDSPATQKAALAYVDSQLAPLFGALERRGPAFAIFCSDHGEAYGEDGFRGHRLAHPTVWTVPYAQFEIAGRAGERAS